MNYFDSNENGEGSQRINLDELYEKKHKSDLYKLSIYKKVLEKVKTRIQIVSRRNKGEQFLWYILPEVMLGAPKFDKEECTVYVINELRENGFVVRYTHPNLIFVSWQHWVPQYVRDEIKKQTGLIVNGMGETIGGKKKEQERLQRPQSSSTHSSLFPDGQMPDIKPPQLNSETKKAEYRAVSSYEPSGVFSYSRDMLKGLNKKIGNENTKI